MKSALHEQKCQACEGIGQALNPEQIKNLMPQLDKEWKISSNHKML